MLEFVVLSGKWTESMRALTFRVPYVNLVYYSAVKMRGLWQFYFVCSMCRKNTEWRRSTVPERFNPFRSSSDIRPEGVETFSGTVCRLPLLSWCVFSGSATVYLWRCVCFPSGFEHWPSRTWKYGISFLKGCWLIISQTCQLRPKRYTLVWCLL